MLFKPYHIKMIEDGVKVATRRMWDKPRVKVGGTYACQTKMYQKRAECHIIKVNELYEQALGNMTEEDAHKEGGYTLDAFKVIWEEIVGEWDPSAEPYVVEFEHIESPRGW